MARQHGKSTAITIATQDVSQYCKTSNLERNASTHNTTGYSPSGDAETFSGGTKNAKFTCGGVYESQATATSPRAVLKGLEGSTLAIVRKPEGTGTGKPNEAFSGVLEKYAESSPHDDMVTWSAEFQVTGPIVDTLLP